VSAYWPCESKGVLTTYQQQVHHGAKHKSWVCPQTRFLQDLRQEILQWTMEGKEVIVLADMNKDISAKDIVQFCITTNLVKAIMSLHGMAPVPTHQQGSRAIDGIFMSTTLLIEARRGFLAFSRSNSKQPQSSLGGHSSCQSWNGSGS